MALCFLLSINCSIEENLELTLMSTPLFTSVLVYSDLKSEKSLILRDNKGKSGIYMWTNKVNGKIYIGSSVDLSKRLRNYFNVSYLSDLKDIMIIYKALLAHGFDNFKFPAGTWRSPLGRP
uniref:GIY-YIG endonuclease n=1 Tax=Cryphonectria parasitica TaxID=5116 RepID=A0A191MX47_CRYPA|nr:GIY-YIG endonuclease [Cryphonectria parasitica]